MTPASPSWPGSHSAPKSPLPPYLAYAGLHGGRDDESGKPDPSLIHDTFASDRLISSLLQFQVVVGVYNLMRQRALLFKWLEVTEAMRAYLAQHMDDNEELYSKLKLAKSELTTTRKVAVKEAGLLRKTEKERDVANVEAPRLKEEEEAVKSKCKKVEQENEGLRKEMEKLQAGFVAQKEELEGEYQKQVDDIFFFGYRCCMKKHGIT